MFINQWAQTAFGLTAAALPERLEQLLNRAGQIFLQTHILPMLRNEGVVKEIYLQVKGAASVQIPMLLNAQQGMLGEKACYRWVMLPAQHRAEFEQQLLKNRQQMQEFARAAESDRKILQTVLDGVKDVGILALSAGGSIEFANIGAELIFHAEAQELARNRITDWLSLPDDILHALSLPSELNGDTNSAVQYDIETELQLNDGRRIAVQLQLRRLAAQQTLKALSFIVIVTDIQQRKQYQALQDNFVANISHELRTPLTSILGALKLLSFDKKSVYTAQSQKLLDLTVKNADRLQQLIIDILDFSKLTAGKVSVQLQTKSLAGFLQQAIDEQLYYLPEKQIQIVLELPVSDVLVQTDAGRFLQIMSNLLSNAKKFSPANSEIKIETEMLAGFVKVSITDQGPGIADSFIPLLFSQFRQQDDSISREYEGTGLGLSICKQLTELMGGEIGYQKSEDGGATFWFTTVLALLKNEG
ncbi:HAMP domain-containing sensor histidine kinase [Rheinheimera baltica]|nr:HAMP domain-containing sensor histidine kinase [Rheinheimera baltica]MDP5188322.1 HAMP domain-containing sensor histidine kinase [Rheinheimera baltica]